MKKYLVLFGMLLLIVLFVAVLPISFPGRNMLTQQTISPTPTPIRTPSVPKQSNWTNIQPGRTTKEDVVIQLGKPATTAVKNSVIVFSYPIEGTTRANKVYIENGTVQYIMEEIPTDNALLQDHIQKTKETEDGVVYDPVHRSVGFSWHVFARSGVAYLASSNNYTIQVLHFPPMSYQNFLTSVAKTFSLSTTPYEDNEKF